MSSRVVPRQAAELVTALLLGAAPVAAQGPGVFEVFASRQQSPSTPLLGGISFGSYHGAVGLRFSGALNLVRAQDSAGRPSTYAAEPDRHRGPGSGTRQRYADNGWSMLPSIGAWSADADLIFAPVRPVPALRALLLGFSPYAFAGIGGYGVRPANAPDTSSATWSLGAGAHHELLGWLGVGAEARYRQAFANDSGISPTWQDKLQYRVGLTVSFGGRRRSREPEPVVVAAPPAPAPSAPCERAPCPNDDPAASRMRDSQFMTRLLDFADGFVGTRYAAGGSTPRAGFDAAGFVRYVYGEQGLRLPATARDMATVGTDVSTHSLRPGDLLFFSNDRSSSVDHVAIYVADDRIIHSTASGNGVRYDTLGNGERGRWFAEHLVSARRVITDGDAAPRSEGSR